MLLQKAIAFAQLGKVWEEAIASFAEAIPISDPEVIQDVLDLLDEQIGNAEKILDLKLVGDRLSGLVEQRLSFVRTQILEFDITGDRMRYKLAPESPSYSDSDSDEEWQEVVEYAAATGKKPKCKPGNIDCGQKCQSVKMNCFYGMSPEEKKAALAAIRKAKAAAAKAGAIASTTAKTKKAKATADGAMPDSTTPAKATKKTKVKAEGETAPTTSGDGKDQADERSKVREEFRPFYDMAVGGNPDDVAIDSKALTAARSIMYDGIDNYKVERIRVNHPDLTEDEAEGLSTWLGEKGCNVMNKRLYAPESPDPNDGMLAVDMLTAKALHKIPPITKEAVEGFAQELGSEFDPSKPLEKFLSFKTAEETDRFLKQFQSNLGKEYRESTFLGVTHDRDQVDWVAQDANVVIKIKPKLDGTGSGRYVDHFKNSNVEAEVLYPPQTKFKVVSVTPQQIPSADLASKVQKSIEQQFSKEDLQQADVGASLSYAFKMAKFKGGNWKSYFKHKGQSAPKTKAEANKLVKKWEKVAAAKEDLMNKLYPPYENQMRAVIELEEI